MGWYKEKFWKKKGLCLIVSFFIISIVLEQLPLVIIPLRKGSRLRLLLQNFEEQCFTFIHNYSNYQIMTQLDHLLNFKLTFCRISLYRSLKIVLSVSSCFQCAINCIITLNRSIVIAIGSSRTKNLSYYQISITVNLLLI